MTWNWVVAGLLGLAVSAGADSPGKLLFDFEDGSTQGWAAKDSPVTLSVSRDKASHGSASLAVAYKGEKASQAYMTATQGVGALEAGSVVTFHVFLPAGAVVNGAEPFSSDGNGNWDGTWTGEVKLGEWNSFSYRVPCGASLPLQNVGLYLFTSGPGQFTAFVDQVEYTSGMKNVTPVPTPELIKLTPVE